MKTLSTLLTIFLTFTSSVPAIPTAPQSELLVVHPSKDLVLRDAPSPNTLIRRASPKDSGLPAILALPTTLIIAEVVVRTAFLVLSRVNFERPFDRGVRFGTIEELGYQDLVTAVGNHMVGGTNGETITLNIRNVADRRIFRISLRLGSWDTWSEAIAHGGGIEFFNQALRDTFQRVIDERIEQATYPISLQRKIGNSIFELVLATLDVRFSPFDPSDRQ